MKYEGRKGMNEKARLELECVLDLERIFSSEIPVLLCGRPSSLGEVAAAQVRETGIYTYMADVVDNEEGSLLQIRFDKVSMQ